MSLRLRSHMPFMGAMRRILCLPNSSRSMWGCNPRLPASFYVGSLPPGLPRDIIPHMIDLARHYDVQTLADIHSDPLRLSLRVAPWLIKPNLAEFHELMGYDTDNISDRVRASRDFCRETGIALALSMSENGLLLTTSSEQYLLPPPPIEIHLPDGPGRNVIGCGDALVGALAYEYSRSKDLLAAAKFGVAAAHCNLGTYGVPEIDAEQVRELSKEVQSEVIPRINKE
jgi:1-phosphofructokinase